MPPFSNWIYYCQERWLYFTIFLPERLRHRKLLLTLTSFEVETCPVFRVNDFSALMLTLGAADFSRRTKVLRFRPQAYLHKTPSIIPQPQDKIKPPPKNHRQGGQPPTTPPPPTTVADRPCPDLDRGCSSCPIQDSGQAAWDSGSRGNAQHPAQFQYGHRS